jgi:hypothetical protein
MVLRADDDGDSHEDGHEDIEMSSDEDNDDDDDDDYYHDYDDDDEHQINRYLELEMRMVERNDPTLTKLEVGYMHNGGYSIPPGDDWAGLGNAIARNKYLKDLSLYDNDRDKSVEYLLNFLPGLSLNCSIKKLSIGGWNYSDGEVWNYLTQFFKHNHNFECLKVQCNSRLSTHELISALRRFDSLKQFKLNDIPCDSYYKAYQNDVILALTGHTGLRRLTFKNVEFGDPFGINPCCSAVATLLMNPLSNLTKLHLHNTNIDDEGATKFSTGLKSNSTLSELIFTCERIITGIGWTAIFLALQSSRCMLVELFVRDSTFSYDATLWLFAALLRHNTTIKTLSLVDVHSICVAGWKALFQPLWDPTVVLEMLYLDCSSLTNEVLFALTAALTNNSRLKELTLRDNDDSIHLAELVLFSNVLRNPNSALEMLDLSMHPMDDQTIISFAEALSNNGRLKYLMLNVRPSNTSVTSIAYGALVKLLCNKSSIMDTFLSNHILNPLLTGRTLRRQFSCFSAKFQG